MDKMEVEHLSLETVIIVACVCATVVLILTIILIVLCCQRNHEYYEKTETYIGNVLDCPATDLQIKTLPSAVQAPPVKSNNVEVSRNVVDNDKMSGVYNCTEHTTANQTLQKVQNIDNQSYDCKAKSSETTEDLDKSNATSSTDDKRPKKIIYEVIV